MNKMRNIENIHLPIWLLKDTFWMLGWKLAGMTMITPALLVAIMITVISLREEREQFWVNMAVFFWISANSWWMVCEFYDMEERINYALLPFLLGMLSVSIFYVRRYLLQKKRTGTT